MFSMPYRIPLKASLFFLLFSSLALRAQTVLTADGQTDTYTLINSTFGGSSEEVPDCSHPDFGPHITQEWDNDFNKPVFFFYIHVTPDNDRCINFDRQRNEIKAATSAPDSVRGFFGDTVMYRWAFKLDNGFQPSPSFTHIHQIKAVDGDNGAPIITITPRSGSSNDILQIINVDSSGQTTVLTSTDLTPFEGQWIDAQETVTYDFNGSYSLTLTRISDGAQLLSFSSDSIDVWRNGTTWVRPKWGIYRSLNHPDFLRDEVVHFDQLCISKNSDCPAPGPAQ